MSDITTEPAVSTQQKHKGRETTVSHSVRTPIATWNRLKQKAERVGLTPNRVIIELIEGWVRGVYVLPTRRTETVRVYDQPGGAAAPAPQ